MMLPKYPVPLAVNAVVDAYGKVFGVVATDVIAPEILSVDDAWIPDWNHIGDVVALVLAPKLVVGVNGKICESDELDTLLLKVVQSAEVRKPLVDALAA